MSKRIPRSLVVGVSKISNKKLVAGELCLSKLKGFVYLFRYDSRFYKIGFSKNVEKRVKNVIPTMLPFAPEVTIEHKIACLDKIVAEKYFHHFFGR